MKRNSINFQFPEVRVILDELGKPVEIRLEEHGIAEQLIEEFMIAANRVVSEDMSWKGIPFIYRVHDQPDLDRLQEFNTFIHNFGYFLKGIQNEVHPRALQNLLEEVEGKPEERIINTLLLRSMKKAIYAPSNIGHFGLAIDYYSHFTAPIRRYPDFNDSPDYQRIYIQRNASGKENCPAGKNTASYRRALFTEGKKGHGSRE